MFRYHVVMENRTDRLTAVYVDLAVNISIAYGMATGVRSLHDCGVVPAVIQRVLIDGGPRRGVTSATPEPSSRVALHIPHTAGADR